MNTKIALSIILGSFSFATGTWAAPEKPLLSSEERLAQEKENMTMLAEMGLPLPGSGIKLVPRAVLGRSDEEMKQAEQERSQMQEQGYINKYTSRPKELLNLHNEVKREIRLFAANARNPRYTGISPSVKDLKLAFDFKSVNEQKAVIKGFQATNQITFLGATPQGGYHEEKGGWSGAAQFFDVKNIGSCEYNVMNVKASNTAVELAMEDVTYTVNNKPTVNFVEGNPESGFLYKVEWYDNENFHELNCANMRYSSSTNESVISLAKRIDSR